MNKPNVYAEFGDFQIRDVCHLGSREYPDKDNPPTEYDVVKWQHYEPREVIDGRTGKKIMSDKSCYSIGFLKFDIRDCYFEFESVGLRYLEDSNKKVNNWILKWCEKQSKILEEKYHE